MRLSKTFSNMIYFLMAIGFLASLFADDSSLITSMENDPSSIVAGRVSAITGSPVIFEEDLIIQGVESIRITRAYVGGQWVMNNVFESAYPIADKMWVVTENNGVPITYKQKGKQCVGNEKFYRYEPINLDHGFSNTSKGKISSRTNLKNNYVLIAKNSKKFILHSASGSIKTYQRYGEGGYQLVSEQRPNGNWVLYEYEKVTLNKKKEEKAINLKKIWTTNPSRTITYAKADFLYEDPKHTNQHFYVNGSDGQSVEYRFDNKEWKPHAGPMIAVISSQLPNQTLFYTRFTHKCGKLNGDFHGREECRLRFINLPLHRQIEFGYYKKDIEWVAGKRIEMEDYWIGPLNEHTDPRRSRVKEISSQVGTDNKQYVTHSFIYDLKKQKTSVYEIDGNRTDYFWDLSARLKTIERRSKDKKLLNIETYVWGFSRSDTGNLICKTFKDSNDMAVFSKRYFYDSRGNPEEERFYGNLSGKGGPLAFDGNGIVTNGEFYAKRFKYSYGEPNLLIEESEDSGLRIVYEYLSGTDLLVSQMTYDNQTLKFRKSWEYNIDHILIREVDDDGLRKTVREITPNDSGTYIGLPSIIEEKYWENGAEHLLRKTILTYGKEARIIQKDIYDAERKFRYSLKMDYDEKGRLIRETNPLGQESIYAYDECGNRILSKDYSGRMTELIDYDYSNRPIRIKKQGDDGIILETRLSYDLKHHLVAEVNAQGHETKHAYDSLGRRMETRLPAIPDLSGIPVISSFQKAYDSAGNVIQETDAEDNTAQSTYNAYGKPIRIVYPDGAKEEYVYNLDGSINTYIDPKGISTSYCYDALGRIIRKTMASAEEIYEYSGHFLACKIDAEGHRTTYSYDGAGRKSAEELAGEKTLYFYDALGRVSKTQFNDFCTISEYDLLDRVIEERTESNAGEVLRKSRYAYDAAGNRKTVLRFVAGKEAKETYEYDSLKRLIYKRDALGSIETISYNQNYLDSYGQRVLQKIHTDPMGLKTIETFNAFNLPAKTEKRKDKILSIEEKFHNRSGLLSFQINTIFAPDGSSRRVNTRWDYDNRGRLSRLTEADGTLDAKITRRDYTSRGELHHMIKPDGTILTYDYNDLGHLIFLSSSDGTVHHEMKYDKLGRLIWDGGLERVLDAHGRILSEVFPEEYSLKNRYDLSGRRIECSIPAAACLIEYEYNALDLQRVIRKSPNEIEMYSHEYSSYDLAGNLLKEKLINGTSRLNSIDPLSRKTAIYTPLFSQEVLQYDLVGNILQMRIQQDELAYTYDELYQLTSESGLFAHNYLFDSLNNRLKKDNETYQINDLQQVISHLQYDKNGNPIQFGDTRYTYDALDRLIRLETPILFQTFTYDSQHRCLSKTSFKDGVHEIRHFLYDGRNEIGSFNERLNLIDLRILGSSPHAEIGAAVALELNGKTYTPIHDLQGNLATILSLQEGTSTFYRYSAFGEEQMTKGEISPWRYSSKRTDENTGLVNFGRRFYMPDLGRWLTPDPAGFTDGMNLYAFVHNDPLTHVDEYGLMAYLHGQGWQNCPWGSPFSYSSPSLIPSFAPENWNRSRVDSRVIPSLDLYQKRSPHYYINGILNTVSDSRVGAGALRRSLGASANVIPMYSESFGTCGDLLSVLASKNYNSNYTSYGSRQLSRELRSSMLCMDALNDSRKVFVTAFSRGAADTYHALKRFTAEQRNRLIVTACGPIIILPRNLGFSVTNLISTGDWCSINCITPAVPMDMDWYIKKNPSLLSKIFDDFADVFSLSQKDGFSGFNKDHFFLSQTYQEGIKNFTSQNYEKYGGFR